MIDSKSRPLVVLTAAACAALVTLQLLGFPWPAAAAKFLASSGFIAIAFRNGAWQSPYGKLVLGGLALSWCGDMFLVGVSRQAFLAGLAAFLLAHVAYLLAFAAHGFNRYWVVVTAIPVTAIAIAVFSWLGPHTPAALVLPVRSYIVVISLMVIFAFGTRGHGGSVLIPLGATLFFLSDLSVAALRIVQTDVATYVVGLPLYYAGQVCLALSVSQSRSHWGVPAKRSAR